MGRREGYRLLLLPGPGRAALGRVGLERRPKAWRRLTPACDRAWRCDEPLISAQTRTAVCILAKRRAAAMASAAWVDSSLAASNHLVSEQTTPT